MTRIPCPRCAAMILPGARKCRGCKAWLSEPAGARAEPRLPRVAVAITAVTVIVLALLVSSRESPVGEAPPLTALGPEPARGAPSPVAIGGETDPEPEPPQENVSRRWKVLREIKVGDVHPLDVVYAPKGQSVYVSGDDASVREYKIKNGELVHRASVPAQGDSIRLLFDRYIAVLRRQDAARVPVLDTTAWDRDAVLLDVGRSPADVIEMPDGKTIVVGTTDAKRVSRFELPSGARLGNITLPHVTGQIFHVHAEGRSYLAAMGSLFHSGRPAGAWIDLFDPEEMPFGATRRSISVGREPERGAVSADGTAIFFPDRVSNTATWLRVSGETETRQVPVGQSPQAAFLLDNDRYGVTVSSATKSVTVVDMSTMSVNSTLRLEGVPRSGVASPDRRTLFIALGGTQIPPKGSGVVVISGSPPRVAASLPTGDGAAVVSVSKDGSRAAVANYMSRTITILEHATE